METAWLTLVALMVVVYAVLDGLDLGAGILHAWVGRDEAERDWVARSIGPVWNGNEIWLLAAGGAVYLAFPRGVTAIAAGLYAPFVALFWLLIVRGASIEVCQRATSVGLRKLGRGGLAVASILSGPTLAWILGVLFFGETSGSLGASGFVASVGAAWVATLVLLGALRIGAESSGALHRRAMDVASLAWCVVGLMTVVVIGYTSAVQPRMLVSFADQPSRCFFPALAIAGLAGVRVFETATQKLISACAYVVGMLASLAAGLIPALSTNAEPASQAWWIPGMLLMASYFSMVCRHRSGASVTATARSEAVKSF